jgi:peptidoglycan/xylan/chitin deacetylase (PgdA/CDA1 family)
MIEPLLIGGGAGLTLAAAGIGYATFAPPCPWFGPVVSRGSTAGPPRLALTFDDGPNPAMTEQILKQLERAHVPACFFCIGRNVQDAPEILQQADQAGHLLANHSFDHSNTGAFHGRRYWLDQLERTNAAIHDTIDRVPRFFRPPMGIKTPRVLAAPRQLGMITVTWTHRGFDTRSRDAERMTRRLTRRLTPGGVLLLHDGAGAGRPYTNDALLDALPRVIDTARDQGFAFARLDELIDEPGYATSDATPLSTADPSES